MVDGATCGEPQAGDVPLSSLRPSSAGAQRALLIAPEGDTRRRRHAHSACVLAARERGELPLREDWQRAQPRAPSLWRRLLRRG